MTNCTVKEMIDRVHKIELLNEFSSDPTSSFIFHKHDSSHSTSTSFELPTESEIYDSINICKLKAIEDAIEMGLIVEEDRDMDLECKVSKISAKKKYKEY